MARINDKELQKAQATLMIARRLTGHSAQQIADEFGMSRETVNERLKLAKQMQLIQDYRDSVINDLVPMAIDAFKMLLAEGNYDAARDVLQGLGVVPKPGSQSVTVTEELTLDRWRAERNDESGTDQATLPAASRGDSPAISEAILLPVGEDVDPTAEGPADPGEPGKRV